MTKSIYNFELSSQFGAGLCLFRFSLSGFQQEESCRAGSLKCDKTENANAIY
jgi:hypothetical protein